MELTLSVDLPTRPEPVDVDVTLVVSSLEDALAVITLAGPEAMERLVVNGWDELAARAIVYRTLQKNPDIPDFAWEDMDPLDFGDLDVFMGDSTLDETLEMATP